MADLDYTIDDDGAITFPATGHRYRVRQLPRGKPAVTLDAGGAILGSDRLDLQSAKERTGFAERLNGRAEIVGQELLAVAQVVDDLGPVEPEPGPSGYDTTADGLVWHRPIQGGTVPVPLTNFTARIVADVAEDDGSETRRHLEIEARLNGRTIRFTIPAERFSGMGWTTERLGASAIVYPGISLRDHARVAIQILSGDIPERRVYAHLGWRQIAGAWVYLHGGGAIGPLGPVPGIEVRLPELLDHYGLPDPPAGDDLRRAITASLGMLSVAPARITYPLLAALYRAPSGDTDFGLHAAGDTGTGKTELTALCQQHWGSEMDARHLPGSWTSTGNSLEALAFAAKDAILTVDDFAPGGTTNDIARLHREADRLFRAQGNHAGRLRMRADSTLRPSKPPRGLIVSSGEDIPRGQSLRARLLILDIDRGDLDWGALTTCQRDAAAGRYAEAMAGYVQWLSSRYDDIRRTLKDDRARYRAQAVTSGAHQRTPGIVADLAIGLEHFLAYAQDAGAITADEAESHRQRGWAAIGEAAGQQAQHLAASDPVRRFVALLSAAIGSGEAHIAGVGGKEPESPSAWGWRSAVVGSGEFQRAEWRPQGKRIGWLEGADLYLEPEASYQVAQHLARDSGDGIAVAARTLHKRLNERGLLATTDQARNRLLVRVTAEGRRHAVLHLKGSLLSGKPAQTAQTAQVEGETPDTTRKSGPVLWAGFATEPTKPAQQTAQNRPTFPSSGAEFTDEPSGNGPIGPFGPVSETYTGPPGQCRSCAATLTLVEQSAGYCDWCRARGKDRAERKDAS